MPYSDPVQQKRASHEWYLKNKKLTHQRSKNTRTDWARRVDKLKNFPCMDCGKNFPPCVMDYDHRDPSQKVAGISRLIRMGNWSNIVEEIKKCDLVCANCHRIRTQKLFVVWGQKASHLVVNQEP